MDISLHVIGTKGSEKELHNTFRKMIAVWKSCDTAGIDVPDEVVEYFDEIGFDPEEDDPKEALLDEDPFHLDVDEALEKWQDYSRWGYMVDLSKLPEGVTHLIFYAMD